MQARYQGDKWACLFFKYRSLSNESSESYDESESDDVSTMSYKRLLQILTFLFCATADPFLLRRPAAAETPKRISEPISLSASEFLRILCNGVIMWFYGVAWGVTSF